MVKHVTCRVFQAALVAFGLCAASGAAYAADDAPPKPTYHECFQMAQKASEADLEGAEMQHDATMDEGISAPADLPKSDSEKAFEKQLQANGVTLKPSLRHGGHIRPRIEIPNYPVTGQDDTPKTPYQQRRAACKTLYGISF